MAAMPPRRKKIRQGAPSPQGGALLKTSMTALATALLMPWQAQAANCFDAADSLMPKLLNYKSLTASDTYYNEELLAVAGNDDFVLAGGMSSSFLMSTASDDSTVAGKNDNDKRVGLLFRMDVDTQNRRWARTYYLSDGHTMVINGLALKENDATAGADMVAVHSHKIHSTWSTDFGRKDTMIFFIRTADGGFATDEPKGYKLKRSVDHCYYATSSMMSLQFFVDDSETWLYMTHDLRKDDDCSTDYAYTNG